MAWWGATIHACVNQKGLPKSRYSSQDTMFSTSIHELTACIYYKLAIERGIRGCNATKEFDDHCRLGMQLPVDCDRVEQPTEAMRDSQCEEVRNEDLNEVIRYGASRKPVPALISNSFLQLFPRSGWPRWL